MLDLFDARSTAIDTLHAATAIYTRSPVISDLLNLTNWPHSPGQLVDPSCGDGAFLNAALLRLKPAPGDIETACRVQGWEIHAGACTSARHNFRDTLVELGWNRIQANNVAQKQIIQGDFITTPPPAGSISFLVGNPPFLRWANIPDLIRLEYRSTVAKHAQSDILHAFLDICDTTLTQDGVLAFVSADRWLLNATTADLRAKLGLHNGLSHLSRIDPSTSFYRPKFRQTGTPPRIHPVTMVMERLREGLMPITSSPMYPLDDTGDLLPNVDLKTETVPLSSLCEVRLAPWLGPKGIFYLSHAEAADLGIPQSQTLMVIDSKDLPPHEDALSPSSMVAIRTFRHEEPSGAIRKHLLARLPSMPERGRQKTWWLPPEAIPPISTAPGILIPRIANRLRAVPIQAGLMPISHNYHILSRPNSLTNEQLISILRHPEVQRIATSRAPRLENGYYDFRTHFIRNLPIPVILLPQTPIT